MLLANISNAATALARKPSHDRDNFISSVVSKNPLEKKGRQNKVIIQVSTI